MTDGLIQQVFKPYSAMNENIVWLLDRIEKELIEKIKQESYMTHYRKRSIGLTELIGDNQE